MVSRVSWKEAMSIDLLILSLRTTRERLAKVYGELDDGVYDVIGAGDVLDTHAIQMAIGDAIDFVDKALSLRARSRKMERKR